MKKATVFLLLALCAVAASPATFPSYENATRHWGHVTEVYVPGGASWTQAFTLLLPDGNEVRYDCRTEAVAVALHCNEVARGDSILVSGHADDVLSCRWDGADYVLVPNVIYRCNGPGPCIQLTP